VQSLGLKKTLFQPSFKGKDLVFIVNLLLTCFHEGHITLRVIQLAPFKKEIKDFPSSTREDLFSLIVRFANDEIMSTNDLKIFKIDERLKVYEFRTKDQHGNWRVISTVLNKELLILIYAFHKKSQSLLDKDKEVIRKRL